MAGRPRNPQVSSLPRAEVPEPPDDLTDLEKDVWVRLAREVSLVGTYDRATHMAFCSLVRTQALEESMDLSVLNTAVTRILTINDTKRASFGLSPASRKKVNTAPLMPGGDPDDEFTGDQPRRPLRAVPAPKAEATAPVASTGPKPPPWARKSEATP